MSDRLKAISLFTGAGGFDHGLGLAGFRIVLALEIDARCCATIRRNMPDVPLVEGDVAEAEGDDLLVKAGCRRGEVDLIVGGAPCQPFSRAGRHRTGDTPRLNDPRAATLRHYLRLVEEIQPRAFLMENVDAFAAGGRDEGLRLVLEEVKAINERTGSGYVPRWAILNAADYGVPQTRKRFFLAAARDGTEFFFPCPTHSEDGSGGLRRWRTAWDAIGDMAPPEDIQRLRAGGKWAALLPCIPEGWNYSWHTKAGQGPELFGKGTRYWNFMLKLAKAKPSWTITASVGPGIGPFHWTSRCLSVREAMRLQTFPDQVVIDGDYRSCMSQVGNAVPSLMGEVLGREVAAQFFKRARPSAAPSLLPPDRSPPPEPEPTMPLPAQYEALVGDHAEHPGAGLGPGAVARDAEKPTKPPKADPAPKARRGRGREPEWSSMPGRAARRLLALRIALSRAGQKPEIPLEAFREECLKRGIYDRANFAQDMTKDARLFRQVRDRRGGRVGWSLTKAGARAAREAMAAATVPA